MENNKKFKIGDTVRLKSGGLLMTINAVGETDSDVSCTYFHIDPNGCVLDPKIYNAILPSEALIPLPTI